MIAIADATALPLDDGSVDLVFGSPPYCDARTYGIDAQRGCQEWIDWMLEVTADALRVCRGAVVWVAAGVTRKRTYWPACEGLMYEWWKRGGSMYRPCYWHKIGIPGSGGDQWFRADVEYVMCFKREGKLPWSENTAMGHTPRYAPGGDMSHRLTSGERRNQWGGSAGGRMNGRNKDGTAKKGGEYPSHVIQSPREFKNGKRHTKTRADGQTETQTYIPPVKANPGNLIHTKVGGGHLGDKIAHENEAPFPEPLAEFFIRSLCPPGGTVLDPFSGSGTTAKVSRDHGRKFIATDIRESQVKLTERRLSQGVLIFNPKAGRQP